MSKLKHTAIYIPANVNKDLFIEEIFNGDLHESFKELPALKGEVFSNAALNQFIDEEFRHEHFEIVTETNKSLHSMSNGEQKKALLSYLIAKKPGFLILDNIIDNLDHEAQVSILLTLQSITESTIIIQLFNRKGDLLPFIKDVYFVEGTQLVFGQQDDKLHTELVSDIPTTYTTYALEKTTLVKFNKVSVSYDDRPILKDICWEIKSGEFWQLIGPNGSGKSTLLSMITGDNPKGYGQNLMLFGRKKGSGESVWEIKDKIGYFNPTMTQQFSRESTIEQMIISGFFDSIGLYFRPSEMQIKIAQEWLLLIGLYKERDKPFRSFSLGRQRMILIARAMVKHPPLLILDEPTSGLDDENAGLCTALINKIAAEKTTAIVYVSHRKEAGLSPEFIFELISGENGSTGIYMTKFN